MKITKAAENAVHALVQMVRAGGVGMAADMARALGIGATYAAKILQQLARGGLLVSRQGRGGGFSLALPPERITLRMIVEAIEGETAFNECLLRSERCANSGRCRLRRALSEAQDRFLEVFEDWTLADLRQEMRGHRLGRGRTPIPALKTPQEA